MLTKNGKQNRKVGCLKISVMEDLKAEKINIEVQKSIEKTSDMLTDAYKLFNQLKEVIAKHKVGEEPNKTKSVKVFPWVSKTISNTKKNFWKHTTIH